MCGSLQNALQSAYLVLSAKYPSKVFGKFLCSKTSDLLVRTSQTKSDVNTTIYCETPCKQPNGYIFREKKIRKNVRKPDKIVQMGILRAPI